MIVVSTNQRKDETAVAAGTQQNQGVTLIIEPQHDEIAVGSLGDTQYELIAPIVVTVVSKGGKAVVQWIGGGVTAEGDSLGLALAHFQLVVVQRATEAAIAPFVRRRAA